jgi:carbon-monoxide dehydrogenase small subunit
MVVQATYLLSTQARPDAAQAKRAIEGNLCRCTGYQKIVDAIVDAGQKVAAGSAP